MPGPTFRPRKLLEIDGAYEAWKAAGYPVTLEGEAETLQFAREIDRTNWLIVQNIALRAIAAGAGDLPGATYVQTTSNRRYYMTYAEQLALIDGLTAHGLAGWDNWNTLKRAAEAAQSNPELNAIDHTAGYP